MPLHPEGSLTPQLLAVVSEHGSSRLAEVDRGSFLVRRTSPLVGSFAGGSVLSPDRKALAVTVQPAASDVTWSRLLFANTTTLRWDRRGVRIDGYLQGALWARSGSLLALVAGCCGPGLTLDTIDTVRKKIVAHKPIHGPVWSVARSGDRLVLLGTEENALAPVRVVVIGADATIQSVTLPRIVGGVHFDEGSDDPLGSVCQPGLAVDPAGGVAYVVDPDGLVAEVLLGDLTVSYHEPGAASLLARLSSWLTPTAQAKGLNGPELEARWLGDGILAVTRTDETATRSKEGETVTASAAGLQIVDTADWSVRTLDSGANAAVVADGLLLATGSGWRSEGRTSTAWGNGLAAYGPDGALRWRLHPGLRVSVLAVFGGHALVQQLGDPNSPARPLELVDLSNGDVASTRPSGTYPWLLLGSGS